MAFKDQPVLITGDNAKTNRAKIVGASSAGLSRDQSKGIVSRNLNRRDEASIWSLCQRRACSIDALR